MFLYAVRYQSRFLPQIRCKCLRFFVAKVQKHIEILKMPSYSNIFQQEISFRTQIVDLENEDKNSA